MVVRSLLVAVAALFLLGAAKPPPRPSVTYRLSPVISGGALTSLAVRVTYAADGAGHADFGWPRGWAGETRLWQWVRDFRAEGATSVQGDGQGRWRIAARPGARIVVSYRVVSAVDHDPLDNEHIGEALPIVRPGWFYGVGETLFGAPVGREDAPAAFAWTNAPAGWTFASDLQHLANPDRPHRPAARPGTVADIQESIAFGGRDLHVVGSLDGPEPVRIASRGRFAFSTDDFDRLALRIIRTERAFWGDGPRAPFLVTLAPLAPAPGYNNYQGTGRTDAFALWYGEASPLKPLNGLLAHEYFHTWNPRELGGLDDGDKEALGYWFSEGFTDYYARRLALAAGVSTLQDFAETWNKALRSYDLYPKRTLPNAALPDAFWKDPLVHELPYWRGALIAAVLDAKLRAGDPQGLDALLRLQRRTASAHPGSELHAAALFRTLLRARRPDLDAWVGKVADEGAVVMLPPDAFAPCFTVETATETSFDRGFDIAATMHSQNRVTGLEPGGPADKAGLREGDRISIDESGAPDPTAKRRYVVHEPSGATHLVEYLPEGPQAPVQKLAVAPALDAAARLRCARLFGARGHVP